MIRDGGEEAKKRKKPEKICRRDVENGGGLGGKRKKRTGVDNKTLVQLMSTQKI